MMKNQEGFAPLVVIVGVVIAATIFGGSIYLSNQPLKTPPPYSILVTEKDFQNITDPILKKHFIAWINQDHYKVTTSQTQKKGYTTLEILKNDSVLKTVQNDGEKDIAETISYEDTLFVKDFTNNVWLRQTLDESQIFNNTSLNNVQKLIYKQNDIKPCDNLICYEYEEINPLDPQSRRIFLFDTTQFLLRKEEFIFGEFKTINHYSYDPISIQKPEASKEVTEGKIFRPTTDDVKKVEEQLHIFEEDQENQNQVIDLTAQ